MSTDAVKSSKKRAHILLLEDEEHSLSLTTFILQKAGYQVTAVNNGAEAVRVLLASSVCSMKIDLVVTDMVMPEMAGEEFIYEVKKLGFKIPVIVVTGYFQNPALQDVQTLGVDRVLIKPFTEGELVDSVGMLLGPKGAAKRAEAEVSGEGGEAQMQGSAALSGTP